MAEKKKYWRTEYAKLKGVSPQRIHRLIKDKKLKTGEINGKKCVINCKQNDLLFIKPSHNNKQKKTMQTPNSNLPCDFDDTDYMTEEEHEEAQDKKDYEGEISSDEERGR